MALKQRVNIVGGDILPVGSTAITAHSVVKLDSSVLVVATASTEADQEILVDNKDAAASSNQLIARVGDTVLVRAHDNAIAEGEWLVAAAAGRVDTIGTLTTATQYVLGKARQASSAQDQLISMVFQPGIATKAAS